jgi:tRNA threonylcarbamoyl adenosine modification protein (Sua5/YciO/YrdC/YwlC family)
LPFAQAFLSGVLADCPPPEAANAESHTLSAEVLKVLSEAPEAPSIHYAASFIKRGEVIGVPTDTFYGLAADPFNLSAVERIYRIKGRPETRALPILVNSIEQSLALAMDLPAAYLKLAEKFWPGALTLVVDATHRLPLKVTAHTGRVALRWPNSRVATALIEAAAMPVTGTSANISGFPACSSGAQVLRQLGDRLPLILDIGDTGCSLASTIVDIRGDEWHITREGAVTENEIREVLE